MIISKTPFRISLFGGGTDLPAYLNRAKVGLTVGFAINKYCYIFFRHGNNLMNYNYRIAYSKIEFTKTINKIDHPSVRNTVKFYKHNTHFDLLHNGDLPARTGLGSSSSFTVGMCKIFRFLKKMSSDKKKLAKDAIYIEQKIIKENVGAQDQVFAAYGGLNKISFKKNDFFVKKIILNEVNKKVLTDNLFLIFTGVTRNASDVEKDKIKSVNLNMKYYNQIYNLAKIGENFLSQKKIDIKGIGEVLDNSWQLKKKLSSKVSSFNIDEIYSLLKLYGAYGGKLIGAGGGGFLLVAANKNTQNIIKKKLYKLKFVNFKISEQGSSIIASEKNFYNNY